MSNNLLLSMMSAFSYLDVINGDDFNDLKRLYASNPKNLSNPYPSALSWGDGFFSQQYLDNVSAISVFQSAGWGSLTAYMFADYNTKKVYVSFRGTQEIGDFIEDALLAADVEGPQVSAIPSVVQSAYSILSQMRLQDPTWTNSITVTGHSLGGHLARTFSEVATQQNKNVSCVVFNAPVPTTERGTANDEMIYSNPSKWGGEGLLVHNWMKQYASGQEYIMMAAADHGIRSMVEAFQIGQSPYNSQQFVYQIKQMMKSGEIYPTPFLKAVDFIDTVVDNWSGRMPTILSEIKQGFFMDKYKVNLDGDYNQDGMSEQFTQHTAGSVGDRHIVYAGSYYDTAFLGMGGVSFDGGSHIDLVSYETLIQSILVETVTEAPGWAKVFFAGGQADDVVTNIEKFKGTQGDDHIAFSFPEIHGLDGDDTIFGGDTNNDIRGGEGNDYISAGAAYDDVTADPGNDYLDGGSGDDRLYYTAATQAVIWQNGQFGDGFGFVDYISNFETVLGTPYSDYFDLTMMPTMKNLHAEDGNDTIIGTNQSTNFYLGAGNDIIDAGAGQDNIYGNEGDDQFIFKPGSGTDTIMDFEGAGLATGDLLCIPIGSTYTFTNYSNGDTLFTVYCDANTTPDAYCWLEDGSVPSTAYSSLDVMFT